MPKTVIVPKHEDWDDHLQRFVGTDRDYRLELEHSLVSISKWEQKWHKPFLSDDEKTYEETCDYIRCMCLNDEEIPEDVFMTLPASTVAEVNEYIQDPATATWFSDAKEVTGKSRRKEIVTSEVVYYWMVELNIPESYQYWHFNRLMTLIKVINVKREENDPNSKKKMSRNELLSQNARLNAARRKAMHSKG